MLHIQLFGPPSFSKNDQPLNIKRRTTRSLLIFIAASEKAISREVIVDAFWPDEPFDKARIKLNDTLSKLRADLDEYKEAVISTQELISINHQLVDVDWLRFKSLIAEINEHSGAFKQNQALTASQYQNMSSAVMLWNNRQLMEAVKLASTNELETWLEELRAECDDFIKRVLDRLIQHEGSVGNSDQAIHWLEMTHKIDEYDEITNQALIEAYLDANRHADGQTFFQQLKTLYEEDNEDMPEAILAIESRLNKPSSDPNNIHWNNRPGLPVPFIGQVRAMTELKNSIKRGGGVIIFGDDGSGKTRLIHEFCRQQGKGTRLLVASCRPLETTMPFAPWVNLLRTSINENDWAMLNTNWAVPLSVLMPELPGIRKDLLPSRPNSDTSRVVLMEAIYQLLSMLIQKERVIVFLDDAHWADESSLSVASYLLKRSYFRPGRGLLILAAQAEEKNSLLDNFLMAAHPEPLRRLSTELLSMEELAELCSFAFERSVPLQFLEKLYEDTGGNAYFATQILQAFLESNPELDFDEIESLPMPLSVSGAIQRKFQALTATSQEVITTAAVLGSTFEIPLLVAAVSLPMEDTMLALEELEKVHVIRVSRKNEANFSFVHEKMREGLLQQLNEGRKRMLHRKVALALENYYGSNITMHASLLAQHLEGAGFYPKAFDAWTLAAEHAWNLMSIHEVMDSFRRAERLIPRTAGLTEEQIYKMYRTWNQVAFENDDFKTLESLNLALQNLGKERNSNLLIGAALSGLSDAEMSRNQFAKGLEYAEKALAYVQKTDNHYEQARSLERRGVSIYMLGRIRESQPSFKRSLDLTEKEDDNFSLMERGNNFYQMAITQTLRGYPLDGLENAQQSLAFHQRANSAYGQLTAYSVMGLANYLLTNYTQGREICQRGIELAERAEGWRMYGYLCVYAGLCEMELGLIDDAWEHGQKAIEIGNRQGHGEIVGLGHRVVGALYLRLGAVEKAREAFEKGSAAAGQHFVALENAIHLGYTQILLGEEFGRHTMMQAIKIAEQADLGSIVLFGTTFELTMYLLAGEKEAFETRAEWLRDQIKKRNQRDEAGYSIDFVLTQESFRQGEYEKAYKLAESLLEWYRGMQNCWIELDLLSMMAHSAGIMGLDYDLQHRRIGELIYQIETSIKKAPLNIEWQAFRNNFPS